MTASEVMVEPDTPSISAEPAARSCSRSSSAAAAPKEAVSPEVSTTTSVTALSEKVMVTLTVELMPSAVPS